MATEAIGNNAQGTSVLDQLAASLNGSKKEAQAKSNELGKDAFIKMLVEQLKNQDPTEPIKNEDLAVNLAQFSQVEQLVEINKKLDGGGIGDSASLAAFLGREVLVDGGKIDVSAGKAGSVFFELPLSTQDTDVQIVNGNGSVVAEKNLGALNSGRQIIDLSDMQIPDGSYSVKVNATSASGESFSPAVSSGGIVTGFIPGADPSLLIGDKEIKAADIKLVTTAF